MSKEIINPRTGAITWDLEDVTIQDALVISQCGWLTDVERELLVIAIAKLHKEGRRLHLEYQKEKIENELKQNKDE